MPKELSALAVSRLKTPGLHCVSRGLYLQITEGGGRSWIHRFTLRGRAREMGLGSADLYTLAEARAKVLHCRRLRDGGIDPIENRKAERQARALEDAKALTFQQAAETYIKAHRSGWRNEKHAAQWTATLATYVYPVIGAVSVQAVDTSLILRILEPIWETKAETAGRVRGRIEAVLDWATARGFRLGENPARWRGHLATLLPKRAKVRRVQHHAALPYNDLRAFLARLRSQEGVAARALEWSILTAARTAETIGATATEVDRRNRVWIVPAHRMKAGEEHRVPLCARALDIVDELEPLRDESGHLFPGMRRGRPLSNMAMLKLLERMGRSDLTVHGFRSTFRDWAAEQTNFPNHVVEKALAHAVADKVEAAYRRGDLFEKRRHLMEAWARFCARGEVERRVVALRETVGLRVLDNS